MKYQANNLFYMQGLKGLSKWQMFTILAMLAFEKKIRVWKKKPQLGHLRNWIS